MMKWHYFAPFAAQNEICSDVVFTKGVGDIEAKRAVVVVDIPFGFITQNCISSIDLLKLFNLSNTSISLSNIYYEILKRMNELCSSIVYWRIIDSQFILNWQRMQKATIIESTPFLNRSIWHCVNGSCQNCEVK